MSSSFITKGLNLIQFTHKTLTTDIIHSSNREKYWIMININAMVKWILLITSGNEPKMQEFGKK